MYSIVYIIYDLTNYGTLCQRLALGETERKGDFTKNQKSCDCRSYKDNQEKTCELYVHKDAKIVIYKYHLSINMLSMKLRALGLALCSCNSRHDLLVRMEPLRKPLACQVAVQDNRRGGAEV